MNRFGDILRYELKKLFVSKVSILTFLLCAGFLCGLTVAEYLLISPEDIHVAERERALEGRELDEVLLSRVVDTAKEYGGFSKIPKDNLYHHLAVYINRLMGSHMSVEGISGNYSLDSLTAEKAYQTRMDILHYLYGYFQLTDSEKEYWKQREAAIQKPFVWHANYGVWSMKRNFSLLALLAVMMLGICLAGVFASEHVFRTDDLIRSTRNGKNTVTAAKILAGEIFSAFAGILLLAAVQIPHVVFNGFHGLNTVCQMIVPFCSYPYTTGRLLAVCVCIYLEAVLLTGALVMLLSCTLKNAIAAAGIVCGAVLLDLFTVVSPQLRMLSQVRSLTPLQVLINSSMTDPRLFRIGGYYLTAYQTAGILYLLLTVLACMGTFAVYSSRART